MAVIFPPPAAGGKITSTQFFLIDKGILQWCAKGIVIIMNALIAVYAEHISTHGKYNTVMILTSSTQWCII
ncbi:hypothetical protein CUS_5594 [Ruminococcus albus 8]|uniref:Uncharacterized protein n=1 Tax=Ruminococcus albus 8 TaxID=246199 RepID=E9S8U9_RUMAL|nr:hypothetical protein CUS_5594 [Ruminococcus albus 8]